jgi:Acetyltransferase (GNAT) domain
MPSLVTSAVPAGSIAARSQPTLTAGSGVLLRPWSLGDAPAVLDAYQDEAIQRWHVRRADSLTETREWIAGWQGDWAVEGGAHWAVVEADSGVLLGRAALKHSQLVQLPQHTPWETALMTMGPVAVSVPSAFLRGAIIRARGTGLFARMMTRQGGSATEFESGCSSRPLGTWSFTLRSATIRARSEDEQQATSA